MALGLLTQVTWVELGHNRLAVTLDGAHGAGKGKKNSKKGNQNHLFCRITGLRVVCVCARTFACVHVSVHVCIVLHLIPELNVKARLGSLEQSPLKALTFTV